MHHDVVRVEVEERLDVAGVERVGGLAKDLLVLLSHSSSPFPGSAEGSAIGLTVSVWRANLRRDFLSPQGGHLTIVTADMVFAEDRWHDHHGFVMQGGRILATGHPTELVETFPEHEEDDW